MTRQETSYSERTYARGASAETISANSTSAKLDSPQIVPPQKQPTQIQPTQPATPIPSTTRIRVNGFRYCAIEQHVRDILTSWKVDFVNLECVYGPAGFRGFVFIDVKTEDAQRVTE